MISEYFSYFNFNQNICVYMCDQCVKCCFECFPVFSTLVILIVRMCVFEREENEQERDVILIVVKWR